MKAHNQRTVSVETWILLAGVVAWTCWGVRRFIVDFDHTDFATFYDTGRAWLAGADLYRSGRGPALNLNPPVATLMFAPFALLPERAAILLWMALNASLLAASLWIVARELDVDRSLPSVLGSVVWLGVLMPIVQMLWDANLVWILMLPATLAWREARRGHDAAAGAWLGLVLALKPIFLLFLPYWALRRRWRSVWSAVAVGIGSVALGLAVFGGGAYRSWLTAGRSVTWFADSANVSVLGTLSKTVPTQAVAVLWYLAIGVVVLMLIGYLRRKRSLDSEWALVWIASLLVSPLGWLYYYALAAGPLIGAFRQQRTPMLTAALVSLCVPAPLLINIVNGQPTITWFATALAGLSTLLVFGLLVRVQNRSERLDPLST